MRTAIHGTEEEMITHKHSLVSQTKWQRPKKVPASIGSVKGSGHLRTLHRWAQAASYRLLPHYPTSTSGTYPLPCARIYRRVALHAGFETAAAPRGGDRPSDRYQNVCGFLSRLKYG